MCKQCVLPDRHRQIRAVRVLSLLCAGWQVPQFPICQPTLTMATLNPSTIPSCIDLYNTKPKNSRLFSHCRLPEGKRSPSEAESQTLKDVRLVLPTNPFTISLGGLNISPLFQAETAAGRATHCRVQLRLCGLGPAAVPPAGLATGH